MHHAYLFIGEREACAREAEALLGFPPLLEQGDPDHTIALVSPFGVSDVKALHERAYQKPVLRDVRTFVVASDHVTVEAQQALLKLLEEPPRSARFFFFAPKEHSFLPTLRSRFEMKRVVSLTRESRALALSFLGMGYRERLDIIARELKDKESGFAPRLLNGLEVVLNEVGVPSVQDAVRAVVYAQMYVGRRGASQKILLEHVALALPQQTAQ